MKESQRKAIHANLRRTYFNKKFAEKVGLDQHNRDIENEDVTFHQSEVLMITIILNLRVQEGIQNILDTIQTQQSMKMVIIMTAFLKLH